MSYLPRLLWIEDEAAARRELARIGTDPAEMSRLAAGMVHRTIKLCGLSFEVADILKREMVSLGGDAAVVAARSLGPGAETDLLLIGSMEVLGRLVGRLLDQPYGLVTLAAELSDLLQNLNRPAAWLDGRSRRLKLDRPRIMGVLNVTPDSFSDGGMYDTLEAAQRRAAEMVLEGADLIDIGGESTRPGAEAISPEEEMERVVPVIEAVSRESGLPLSIDTTKASVARAAVAAGAEFVNDISGLQFDSEMTRTVAESGAGLFLMHTRGRPDRMQEDTAYSDLVGEILRYLRGSLDRARSAGINEKKIAIDPGIGFGKSAEGNLEILRRLREFHCLGRPLLLGTSRKSFIGKVLDRPDPADRLNGTLATVALGVEAGARLFRVHDVGAAREAALMAWAIRGEDDPVER